MADTVIAAKLEADSSGAVNSVRNFKKELKEAQQEVTLLSEKFGATSKEAAAAAQKAAGLKDAIGDAASLVDAFNPDTKFRAFSATIGTLAGGFSALQGAIGLVGNKSEETEKLLLKVQSALAISQGVAQVQEGVQTFKNLSAVIQQTTIFQKANSAATAIAGTVMRAFGGSVASTSTAFNVLKGAIIATGIGALVVGIGLVISKITDWIGSTNDETTAQNKLNAALEEQNKILDNNLAKISFNTKKRIVEGKLRGKTEEEIFMITEAGLIREKEELNKDQIFKTNLANQALQEKKIKGAELLKLQNDALAAQKAAREKGEQIELLSLEREFKIVEDGRRKIEDARNGKVTKKKPEEIGRVEKDPLSRIQGLDIEIPKTERQLQIEAEENALLKAASTNQATKDLITNTDKEFTRIHGENVDDRIANEQAELEAKQTIANAGISILGSLSALVGQQTKAGKILALAEIASGTAIGFINALNIAQASSKAAGPGAAFAFPVFYATQLAAVLSAASKAKAILGSSGGGSSISAPTPASVAAPLAPQKAQQTTTTLDQASINAIGNSTVRAFVLEADVTSNQERITRLNRQARIS